MLPNANTGCEYYCSMKSKQGSNSQVFWILSTKVTNLAQHTQVICITYTMCYKEKLKFASKLWMLLFYTENGFPCDIMVYEATNILHILKVSTHCKN